MGTGEEVEVKEKVDDMMRERERREKARELYAAHRATLSEEDLARRSVASTDYSAWDLWTPSDDEDDPWMQFMPGDPAFKAMEADIESRHATAICPASGDTLHGSHIFVSVVVAAES